MASTDELLGETGRQIFMLLTRKGNEARGFGPGDPEYHHLPTCNAGYWVGGHAAPYGAPCSERCQEAHDLLAAIADKLKIRVMSMRSLKKLRLAKSGREVR